MQYSLCWGHSDEQSCGYILLCFLLVWEPWEVRHSFRKMGMLFLRVYRDYSKQEHRCKHAALYLAYNPYSVHVTFFLPLCSPSLLCSFQLFQAYNSFKNSKGLSGPLGEWQIGTDVGRTLYPISTENNPRGRPGGSQMLWSPHRLRRSLAKKPQMLLLE